MRDRRKLNNCVNKLPKVGQCVNLNSYECFFAVKKVQKPLRFTGNAGHQTKDEKLIDTIEDREGCQTARQSANHETLDRSLNSTKSQTSSEMSENSDDPTPVPTFKRAFFKKFMGRISKVMKK